MVLSTTTCQPMHSFLSSIRQGTEICCLHRHLLIIFNLTFYPCCKNSGLRVGKHQPLTYILHSSLAWHRQGKTSFCEAKNPNGISFPIHAKTASPQTFSHSCYFATCLHHHCSIMFTPILAIFQHFLACFSLLQTSTRRELSMSLALIHRSLYCF